MAASIKVHLARSLVLALFILQFVEGKKRAKGGTKAKNALKKDKTWSGITYVAIAFLLSFVPATIYFCYSVARDPLTPTLISNATAKVQEKTMGYLSKPAETKGKRS